jgi:hypothetical protein
MHRTSLSLKSLSLNEITLPAHTIQCVTCLANYKQLYFKAYTFSLLAITKVDSLLHCTYNEYKEKIFKKLFRQYEFLLQIAYTFDHIG